MHPIHGFQKLQIHTLTSTPHGFTSHFLLQDTPFYGHFSLHSPGANGVIEHDFSGHCPFCLQTETKICSFFSSKNQILSLAQQVVKKKFLYDDDSKSDFLSRLHLIASFEHSTATPLIDILFCIDDSPYTLSDITYKLTPSGSLRLDVEKANVYHFEGKAPSEVSVGESFLCPCGHHYTPSKQQLSLCEKLSAGPYKYWILDAALENDDLCRSIQALLHPSTSKKGTIISFEQLKQQTKK